MSDCNGVTGTVTVSEPAPVSEKTEVIETNIDPKPASEMSESEDVNKPTNCGDASGTVNITDLEKKIIRQIEYYFGDMNLPRDKFLQEKMKTDDGWVTLETMISFNRLKILSTDFDVISTALRKSTSDLLEVNDDGTKIRRSLNKPMPENTKERRTDVMSRTVYVKGFPLDATLDELTDFFEKEAGKAENIYLRRDMKKLFKGSVFVIFESKEITDDFLKKEGLKCKDVALTKLLKEEYFNKKNEERRQLKAEKEKKGAESKTASGEDKEALRSRITEGAILHVKGFVKDTQREDIRNYFQDFSKVAWVDYSPGDAEAWVRFDGEVLAKEAIEKAKEINENFFEINGAELEWDILDGDEELNHWKKIFQERAEQWERKRSGRKRKFGGGRGGGRGGGWGGGKKRKEKRESNNDTVEAADSGDDSGNEEVVD